MLDGMSVDSIQGSRWRPLSKTSTRGVDRQSHTGLIFWVLVYCSVRTLEIEMNATLWTIQEFMWALTLTVLCF